MPQSNLTLAEARTLCELAQTDEQAVDIVRTLDVDNAHASRIVARFDDAGLLTRRCIPMSFIRVAQTHWPKTHENSTDVPI